MFTVFSRIDSAIKNTKEEINLLEMSRVLAMLKALKEDENRLSQCIDDIEVFHRDMFVLPNKEDKPADTGNAPTMKDDMNKSGYSVTERECSGNEPMHPMNEEESSMHKPGFSMNEQKSSRRSLILKIPRSIINKYLTKKESDDSFGSSFSMDETDYDMDESGDVIDESGDVMDESGDGKNEPGVGKVEPGEDENEMAKKILLNFPADKEKEITELVLHLIYTFSCFQRRLRTAETSATPTSKFFPGKSNVNINIMLKALSVSVLYLDKTVSNIYAKYSEMLQTLGKIFQ